MLVDIPKGLVDEDSPLGRRWAEIWAELYGQGRAEVPAPPIRSQRLTRGIYHTGLNFNFDLEQAGILETEHPFDPFMELMKIKDVDERLRRHRAYRESLREGDLDSDYGVCDYPQQVIEKYPVIEADPRPFVLSVTQLRREHESPDGGWRWHKWGPYIGSQNPQCEYLYDEPEIEEVWIFHIYQLKDGVA